MIHNFSRPSILKPPSTRWRDGEREREREEGLRLPALSPSVRPSTHLLNFKRRLCFSFPFIPPFVRAITAMASVDGKF